MRVNNKTKHYNINASNQGDNMQFQFSQDVSIIGTANIVKACKKKI